jgi:hypothetical protein
LQAYAAFFLIEYKGVLMAAKKANAPRRPTAPRRPDAVCQSITFDVECWEIIRSYSPPLKRGIGKFLQRLVYEHRAREEERARLLGQSMAVNGGD